MYCQQCGTELQEHYKCCPVCTQPTNEQIIRRNEDKQGCFGFFSGCITVPIKIIGIFLLLGVVSSIFTEITKNLDILLPIAIIIFIVYKCIALMVLKWDTIENKSPNKK